MNPRILANLAGVGLIPAADPKPFLDGPVKSALEIKAERERNQRQVMRHYSLMSWLSKNGLKHRTHPGKCAGAGCKKTISANKTHCAACAPKEE